MNNSNVNFYVETLKDGGVFSIPVQFYSLIFSTLITLVFIIFLYVFVIRKQDSGKEPSFVVSILESYVIGFEKLFDSITGNRLRKAYPYFFTLFNFIMINSFISLLGFEPTPSSIMFTLTLGLITFIGIYVVGIATHGIIGFIRHKYYNPLELFGQFAPLLSITLRLFGATLATTILGKIFVIVLEGVLGPESFITIYFPIFGIAFNWIWRFIDSFLSIIQAFVFVVLTTLYWSLEHGPSWSAKERKKYKDANKDLKNQIKKERKS